MAVFLISLIFSLAILTDSCFNDGDIKIVSSILKFFDKEQYILVSRQCDKKTIITKLKTLSKINFVGIYFSFGDLFKYLGTDDFPDRRALVILKTHNNEELLRIMGWLRQRISDERVIEIFSWMMFLPKNHTKITEDNFHVPFDSRFFLVEGFDIFEIYQIKRNSKMIYVHFGKFTKEGLKTDKSHLYEKRENMLGELLIMERNDEVLCRWKPECLQLEVWEDMGRLLNFSTKYITTTELAASAEVTLPDVTTNITMIHYLLQNHERVVGPLTINIAHLYVRMIDANEERWDSYIKPFDKELWDSLIFILIVGFIAYFILASITVMVLSPPGITIFDQTLTPFTALCNQACGNLPDVLSLRIARIFAYITSGVILPAYSAALISFLTVDIPFIPFTDLHSFVIDGTYKLAPAYNPFMASYFWQANDPISETIAKKHLVPLDDFPVDETEAAELLCDDAEEVSVIYYNYWIFQVPSTCPLVRVSDAIFTHYGGIELLNDGVKYRTLLQKKTIRFYTTGIMDRMKTLNYGKDDPEYVYEFEPISIYEAKFLLVLLVLGFFGTTIIFIAEVLYFQIKTRIISKLRKKLSNRPNSIPKLEASIREFKRRRRQRHLSYASRLFAIDTKMFRSRSREKGWTKESKKMQPTNSGKEKSSIESFRVNQKSFKEACLQFYFP